MYQHVDVFRVLPVINTLRDGITRTSEICFPIWHGHLSLWVSEFVFRFGICGHNAKCYSTDMLPVSGTHWPVALVTGFLVSWWQIKRIRRLDHNLSWDNYLVFKLFKSVLSAVEVV